MNLKLDLKNGVYVVIEKSGYGFNLNIHTPTSNEKAKNTHSANTLFYPSFDAVAKKLIWLGMAGDSIAEVQRSVQDTCISLSKQLAKALELMEESA